MLFDPGRASAVGAVKPHGCQRVNNYSLLAKTSRFESVELQLKHYSNSGFLSISERDNSVATHRVDRETPRLAHHKKEPISV